MKVSPARMLPRGIEEHFPPSGQPSALLIIPSYKERPFRLLGVSYLAGTLTSPPLLHQVAKNSRVSLPETTPPFHVRVLDLSLAPENFDLAGFLKRFDPSLLGVSATSFTFVEAVNIARVAKISVPNALRVIGGYHPSALPEESLISSPFHIAVVGYGEETLSELAMCMHHHGRKELQGWLAQIPGISYKDAQGKVQHNPRRNYTIALDDYPFPHTVHPLYIFQDYPAERVNGKATGYVVSSRGCPFSCKYCAGESMHQRRMGFRSAENILREVRELHERGVRFVEFYDETFHLNREVEAIADGLGAIKQGDPAFGWGMQTRGDRLPPALLERMIDSGLATMALGVETGDEVLAREAKNDRSLRLTELTDNTARAQARGVSVNYNLMVGLPGQGWGSILQTARLLRDHPPDRGGVGTFQLLPGSPYHRTLPESGLISIRRHRGVLPEFDTTDMAREEALSAERDLESLLYNMRLAKIHPAQAEAFYRIAESIIDKLRIWAIYDLLIKSQVSREAREALLRRISHRADPIFRSLLEERTKEGSTFAAMALSEDEPVIFTSYEKFSEALNLHPALKKAHLDPFLREVSFNDALALTSLPFGIIRLFICAAVILCEALKDEESGADLVKNIKLVGGATAVDLLRRQLSGYSLSDLNREQTNFDFKKLAAGGIAVEFLSIPFTFNRQNGELTVGISSDR